jgi:hypothetical protein
LGGSFNGQLLIILDQILNWWPDWSFLFSFLIDMRMKKEKVQTDLLDVYDNVIHSICKISVLNKWLKGLIKCNVFQLQNVQGKQTLVYKNLFVLFFFCGAD